MCYEQPDDALTRKVALKRVLELAERLSHAELEDLLMTLQGIVSKEVPQYDRPQKFIVWKN